MNILFGFLVQHQLNHIIKLSNRNKVFLSIEFAHNVLVNKHFHLNNLADNSFLGVIYDDGSTLSEENYAFFG